MFVKDRSNPDRSFPDGTMNDLKLQTVNNMVRRKNIGDNILTVELISIIITWTSSQLCCVTME